MTAHANCERGGGTGRRNQHYSSINAYSHAVMSPSGWNVSAPMSRQVTDAELAILEYGQIDLQELLVDALTEVQHCKELQFIDSRSAVLLREKAHCAAAHADYVYTDLTQSSTQTTKDLQRDLAGKSCELSAAHLDLHCWKRKVALQQLRLVSVQEDCAHQKVHIEALTAECSRRQEQCNSLHGEMLAARAQNAQLETRLTDSAASSAGLQDQQVELLASLQDKETLLHDSQTKLQESEAKLLAAEKSALEALHAAEQRYIAVEERARLSEQVAAAVRERAEISEQRLAQRAELAQERLQHATHLAQERDTAAAQRAAVTEQGLRSEIVSLKEALQRAHAARFKERDAVSHGLHEKLQTAQTDLRAAQHQVSQKDARIAALEEICRHRDSSATPAKQAVEAMEAVGALVDQLDVTDTAAEAADQAPHAPAPVPTAAAVKDDVTKIAAAKDSKQAAGKGARAAGKTTRQQAAVYIRPGKQPAESADHNAKAKVGSRGQPAVAARGEAAAGEAAEGTNGPSPTNSRPSRPRTKSQPYWMSRATGSSPSANPGQGLSSVPAASDAVLASDGHDSWPDQQLHSDVAKSDKAGIKDNKPAKAKRQARSSPQKEQQQLTKKSRADKKQQPEEKLEAHPKADVAAEQEAQAGAGRVAKQQSKARGDRQGGNAAQHEAEEQAQMVDDASAFDTADPTTTMDKAKMKEVEQHHDAEMDVEGEQGGSEANIANPPAAAAAASGKDPIAGALQRFGLKHPSRPVGVAKIDLASSFIDASSPAHALSAATSKPAPAGGVGAGKSIGHTLLSGAGANKENEGQAAGMACKATLQKPMPNPPTALNPRVTAAAAGRKGDTIDKATGSQPVLPAKDTSQPVVANKRRILKPVNVNYLTSSRHQDVLPANMLFGDAFMVPKLRK
ncbi:TPA: hypothetical protein ACH3X1_011022 [Trebouxia sp. C0004]